jgi:hypothetical protein
VQAWLPLVITIIGGLWAFLLFLDQQRINIEQRTLQRESENIIRWREAWKPYYDRQIVLFTELSRTLGKLAVAEVNSDEWTIAHRRFKELRWGELALFIDPRLMEGIIQLDETISKYSSTPDSETKKEFEQNASAALYGLMQFVWLGHEALRRGEVPR